MSRAKERCSGMGGFDERVRVQALERVAIEAGAPPGAGSRRLRLHYQPIVTLDGGALQSVEALVRWQHPERGLLRRCEFIPIAEETPDPAIRWWTLREACEQAYRLARPLRRSGAPAGERQRERTAARPSGAAPDHQSCCCGNGLGAADLAIELTETALNRGLGRTGRLAARATVARRKGPARRLRTGYSSPQTPPAFPDRCAQKTGFVMNIDAGEDDRAIVRAIAAMASALGLEVVRRCGNRRAGLEAQALAAVGSGYYFARPAPPIESSRFPVRNPSLRPAGRLTGVPSSQDNVPAMLSRRGCAGLEHVRCGQGQRKCSRGRYEPQWPLPMNHAAARVRGLLVPEPGPCPASRSGAASQCRAAR